MTSEYNSKYTEHSSFYAVESVSGGIVAGIGSNIYLEHVCCAVDESVATIRVLPAIVLNKPEVSVIRDVSA